MAPKKKMFQGGSAQGGTYMLHKTPNPELLPLSETKVKVVDPLAEISRLMDEVLLSPKLLALLREEKRIEEELDKLDVPMVRATIKELFKASLSSKQLFEASEVSLFDLNDNATAVQVLKSNRGEMLMIGLNGPFLIKIYEASVEGKGDDEGAVG